ncbi:SpoIIE family protein phosphatase [Bernardetia sp.]|uniref:SpoIIE family protein phosphatase n=1 Tax=Bernardetia sp. TaxID=1937974 RepID=UPI0025BBB339|nr:SpoIIE family protein phosphatase [Bernardetia sp.]
MKQTFFYLIFFTFLGISILSSTLSFAQQSSTQEQNTQNVPYQEAGWLFVKNFSPKEYSASPQNWAITQDKNGIVYIGNTTHLLSFDGKRWERTKIGGTGVVRSLSYSSFSDRVYIGGVGDVGYAYLDSLGNTKYISLFSKMPEKYRNFKDVWKTLVLGEEVFFLTKDFIFIYKNEEFRIIQPRANTFLSAFVIHDKLYVQEAKLGIFEYTNNYLNNLEHTNLLYNHLIVGMVEYADNVTLIATKEGLFYTHHTTTNKISRFEVEKNDFFQKNAIHSLAALSNGQFAIGTATEGIVLIDKNGKWKNHISDLKGLQDNAVWNLYAEKNGNLWVALSQGVAHVQTSWAYTYFGEESRLGKVNKITRFDGVLYAATGQGLFYYDAKLQIWEGVKEVLGQVWDLKIYDYDPKNPKLLIAGQAGIFAYNPLRKKIEKISELEAKHLLVDKTGIVYISTSEGLKKMNTAFKIEGTSLEEPLKRTVLLNQNQIWAETEYKGIVKIDKSTEDYQATFYDSLNGLPKAEIRQLVVNNEQLFVATSRGIFYLDTLKDEFISAVIANNTQKNPNFQAKNAIHSDVSLIESFAHYPKNQNGSVANAYWMVKDNQLLCYQDNEAIESAFLNLSNTDFNDIYEDNKYTLIENDFIKPIFTWVATSEGVYRYDYTQNSALPKDSLSIFVRYTKIRDSLVSNYGKHKLSTDFNNYSVQLVSTAFGQNEELQYRYRLLPSSLNWSPWTAKDEIEFNILPSGEYTLEIQAKNKTGELSNIVTRIFEVSTAWYQRWWAYIIYVGLVFLLAVGFTYLHERNLKKKNKELNSIIAERTQEISQKTEELEAQQKELLSQSQEVFNQKEELASQAEYLKKANKEVMRQKKSLQNANKRLEELSDITHEITSILDTKELTSAVFQRVIGLMPAEGFGVGLLNEQRNTIDFDDFFEKGKILEPHSDSLEDKNHPSVECLMEEKTITINNVAKVWKEKFEEHNITIEKGDLPYAVIYVPLIAEGQKFGVMTVQTFYELDYSEQDILLLQSIASATAIALSNIKAYQLIERRNQEITDSIRYAQTIQESILPTEKEIKRSVGEHYIIYKPKDIVSGDFYWTGYSEGFQYAAVVDCTGHGVPGAFMSMVGSSLLREILYEKEITSPADMLEHLDNEIRRSLRQTGKKGSNTDGMDIILIRYTYLENGNIELDFCGAKRPLIYKEADKEIVQLRGTSRSIGGIQRKKKPFEEHHLTLLPRTTLFLTSDGLIDQPNKDRKKYGTKRFLDKVSEWTHLPISMQESLLLEDLENFREEEEQRDDITIMAINL